MSNSVLEDFLPALHCSLNALHGVTDTEDLPTKSERTRENHNGLFLSVLVLFEERFTVLHSLGVEHFLVSLAALDLLNGRGRQFLDGYSRRSDLLSLLFPDGSSFWLQNFCLTQLLTPAG